MIVYATTPDSGTLGLTGSHWVSPYLPIWIYGTHHPQQSFRAWEWCNNDPQRLRQFHAGCLATLERIPRLTQRRRSLLLRAYWNPLSCFEGIQIHEDRWFSQYQYINHGKKWLRKLMACPISPTFHDNATWTPKNLRLGFLGREAGKNSDHHPGPQKFVSRCLNSF